MTYVDSMKTARSKIRAVFPAQVLQEPAFLGQNSECDSAPAMYSLPKKATCPMFIRSRFLAFTLAVLAMLALVGVADAGWVTFKNDSNKTIVVQEFSYNG